jgi:asparagine synthase (glutamine-hydrolysing)
MCGFIGLISKAPYSFHENDLISARDTMIARGPDDAGIYCYKNNDAFVGLAHRRLSIIDLSPRGRQPMCTSDEMLWIIFNGEIFNYRELRRELEHTGKYVFTSETDTEVILHAYREWGITGSLKRFRGMFAFALHDKKDGSTILVRDPIGVKPLYYFRSDTLLAFASEIKALLKLPGIEPNLDTESLYHYLTFANVPAPHTMFKDISKLEAGHYIQIDRTGSMNKVRYWDPKDYKPDRPSLHEEDYISEIRRLLRQSVARRMVSDVPFGVFLSGGVDSSLNVALMQEQMDRPVETFSIGISGDPANEFEYARVVAQHFRTNHHEILINDDDFIDFLPRMAYLQDEPLADPVCVPLYYISRLARESGTIVIQIGEGSDEIFAGYDTYRLFKNLADGGYQYYSALPAVAKKLAFAAAKHILPPTVADAMRRSVNNEPLFLGNAIAFWDTEKMKLVRNTTDASFTSSRFIKELQPSLNGADTMWKMITLEMINRLPELLLMRVDKMSMGASIETRVPFLDIDLVDFALTIPSSLKQKNGHNKYILKKAAEGIIPDEIIYRKKWGFCGSATNLLTEKVHAYAKGKILASPLTDQIFNRDYILGVFDDYQRQKRFNSFKIWNLLNLVLWHEQWF